MEDLQLEDSMVMLVSKVLFATSGLIMPLTRIYEPFFYTIVARKLKAICYV